ncbi:hypothetical protein [uncultured Tateyamaria sp.]|uniref:hypothetical protein n=1 Tax=uncultured Tateyamaria sp. TaxID=455651 RepID=UPI0026155F27|nr:hypothetical protein [uncultured Tateyamaria sp.]
MSAPDTNLERQSKNHRPALIGMGLVVVAILAFIMLAPIAPDNDAPDVATPAVATE